MLGRVAAVLGGRGPGPGGVAAGGLGRDGGREGGQVLELLGHGQVRPRQEPAPHLNIRGVGSPGVALQPVERGTDRVTGADLVRVLDQVLGQHGVGAADVLQLLLRLVDGGGQQGLGFLQLGCQCLKMKMYWI